MTPRPLLALVLVFAAMVYNEAYGQDEAQFKAAMYELADRASPVMRDVRKELLNGMTDEQRDVLAPIPVRVVPNAGAGAMALQIGSDRPSIVVTAGLVDAIDTFATIMAFSEAQQNYGCAIAYFNAYSNMFAHNYKIAYGYKAGPLRGIAEPFQFSRDSPECEEVDRASFSGSQADQVREFYIAGSLAQILGHEYGHHLYPINKRATSSERRRNELKADQFAMELISKAYGNPLAALPTVYWLAASDGFRLEDSESTHPAGMRRALILIDAALDKLENDQEFVEYLRTSEKKNLAPKLGCITAAFEGIRDIVRSEDGIDRKSLEQMRLECDS